MKKLIDYFKEYWLLFFIMSQPIIDVISYVQTKTLGISFSWIIRMILLIVVSLFVFVSSKNKKRLLFSLLPFGIYFILHIVNLFRVDSLDLILDIKYFVLVFQTPLLTLILIDYIKYNPEKIKLIKSGIIVSFLVIFGVIFLSFITGTYEITYEYSKNGIIGWFTGSNTPSMILCAICPWTVYYFSNKKSYLYFIMCILAFILLYFNATKACYITLISTFIVMFFITLISKNKIEKISKIVITTIFIILSLGLYRFSFTHINREMAIKNIESNKEEIDNVVNNVPNINNNNNNDILIEDNNATLSGDLSDMSDEDILEILKISHIYAELIEIQGEEKVIKYMRENLTAENLANNRLLKVINAKIETENSDIITKILGIGYSSFAVHEYDLETDLDAIYFYYGYLGFGLYIGFIIYFVLLLIVKFFKQPSIVRNGEYIILCYLIPLLIFGGQYSGAFLRKPNANIYLSLFLLLIYFNCKHFAKEKKGNARKKISFLCLHLGYGGIETATINSANALSSEYDVEIISFYNLQNNQVSLLNENVQVKYLCQYEPNKEEFFKALHNHKYATLLKEGIISIIILIQKKVYMRREIKYSDSDAIISTRCDFSVLLSRYGKKETIKIAQEHHHHNNDKKYINILKNKYTNIDYLCALTKGLKKDYKTFLIKNNHTKVILLPNILSKTNAKISNLQEKNIICVSRLDKGKRINELIDIFSKINNKFNKLYIIGDGPELKNLEIKAKELKLEDRVIFAGYLSHKEQEKYYLNSCVFTMTSVSEGLPMVLLEAMQHGLPCIAYKTETGVSDIIKNDINGYIINNRNPKKYIETINFVLKEGKKIKKLSENAIKTSEKFSSDKILLIWKKILN